MFIKDLTPFQTFRVAGAWTNYVAEVVTSEGGKTTVTYRIEGTQVRGRFWKPSLSTITLV